MPKRRRYGRRPTRPAKPEGRAPFVPTDEQRPFVVGMAGMRLTWDEIAQLTINPTTGEPISKTTLAKVFKRELAVGRARHKSLIATGYYAALHERQPWALQLGLRTQFGWRPDGLMPLPDSGDGVTPSIRVSFVRPDPRMLLEDDEPVRQIEHTPVYDPAPPGQRLLSPPSPTDRTMRPILKRNGGGGWMD
jgi:hypothetical protein